MSVAVVQLPADEVVEEALEEVVELAVVVGDAVGADALEGLAFEARGLDGRDAHDVVLGRVVHEGGARPQPHQRGPRLRGGLLERGARLGVLRLRPALRGTLRGPDAELRLGVFVARRRGRLLGVGPPRGVVAPGLGRRRVAHVVVLGPVLLFVVVVVVRVVVVLELDLGELDLRALLRGVVEAAGALPGLLGGLGGRDRDAERGEVLGLEDRHFVLVVQTEILALAPRRRRLGLLRRRLEPVLGRSDHPAVVAERQGGELVGAVHGDGEARAVHSRDRGSTARFGGAARRVDVDGGRRHDHQRGHVAEGQAGGDAFLEQQTGSGDEPEGVGAEAEGVAQRLGVGEGVALQQRVAEPRRHGLRDLGPVDPAPVEPLDLQHVRQAVAVVDGHHVHQYCAGAAAVAA
mmetsp:Transcript_4300/g.13436  ORF Transcript_4300/g.13436 Transcript_4300/m.13436 type:complete len:405 (-) Transcript_4300:1606-2820(-)